jgi:hypothetical protein
VGAQKLIDLGMNRLRISMLRSSDKQRHHPRSQSRNGSHPNVVGEKMSQAVAYTATTPNAAG